MDNISEPIHIKETPTKKSILVHHGSVDIDEESFFRTVMRPRANTDPISPRPCHHVRFDLPDIVVDDCSDNDDDSVDTSHPERINKELANTDEGAFFVFKSPPRQRSNTCPVNMFSNKRKERRNRPPTPPPLEKLPEDTFPRYPSWEKVHFCPHSLTRVEEARETVVTQEKVVTKSDSSTKSHTNCESPTRSRKNAHTRTVKSATVHELKHSTSPSPTPKRPVPRLANGHVGSKSNTIHTSA